MDFSSLNHAIALSGGIATGKSSVCTLLKLLGFSIIDADMVAKECLNEEKLAIKELFGDEYLIDNQIDRKKLATLIFSDTFAKESLEKLLHPKIREKIFQKAKDLEKFKINYIIDIPLFFETNSYDIKNVIVVYAPKEIQLDRMVKRDGFKYDEAILRLNAQLDIEDKRQKATFLIDNSKDLKHLQKEVDRCVEWIKTIKD
ncbi:MAG: dephospho-CoA kinase [Campylobacterales bacterium]|nr:dephospho-CoA kinase [Campylobacterales bacterium]